MKPISDALRAAIDNLRKTQLNNAEPSWKVNIFRDRERMLGVIEGAAITTGPDHDEQPAIAQDAEGRYEVVFGRAGTIYRMLSSIDNVPKVTWGAPAALFPGRDPDLDFDGSFSTIGRFTPSDLLIAYEEPAGTILFRRRPLATGVWSAPVVVTTGNNPSIVRGWADPPEVGTTDEGLFVFYTQAGALKYTYSDDDGVTWAAPITLDTPTGGTKRNAQAFRLSDYTLGFVYEYDNGLSSEVWFGKTTRTYVNIASPDETVRAGAGGFRHFEFVLANVSAPDETVVGGAGAYRHGEFVAVDPGASGAVGGSGGGEDGSRETVSAGAGMFRQVEFTGVSP